MEYNKYNIKDTDTFISAQFPRVEQEINDIRLATAGNPSQWKAELILSYLKQHALKKEWAEENPELTTLMSGGRFTISHIEALFWSCRHNVKFQAGYEDFIKKELAMPGGENGPERMKEQNETREFFDTWPGNDKNSLNNQDARQIRRSIYITTGN